MGSWIAAETCARGFLGAITNGQKPLSTREKIMLVKIPICEPMNGADMATAAKTANIFGTKVSVISCTCQRLQKRDHDTDDHGRENRGARGGKYGPDRSLDYVES